VRIKISTAPKSRANTTPASAAARGVVNRADRYGTTCSRRDSSPDTGVLAGFTYRRFSLSDVATPALDLLLGTEGTNVLAAAVAEYDCRLEDLRPAEVNVDPSGAAIVMYVAVVRRADGSCTTEFIGATTGSRIPGGAAVVAGEYGGEPRP
jgi:hypothetical protein